MAAGKSEATLCSPSPRRPERRQFWSHTARQIEYHFVWVTKYRCKVLTGEVALRVRELVRQTCEAFEIEHEH